MASFLRPRASSGEQSDVVIVGERRRPLTDLYHGFLRARWGVAIGAIATTYLLATALFALGYFLVGGVANSSGSFLDSFYFSNETMGTIGYGNMHPVSPAAHGLVVLESVFGLLLAAVATGLVFAKFSSPSSRIVFSSKAVISPMNGVPTLMLRLGNERSSVVTEARVRLTMVRGETTAEGVLMYRLSDLDLVRDTSQALSRSWTVMHVIDASSPLHGETPESLAESEVELLATVLGVDDTSLQQTHARRRYVDADILWGFRHADILREREDGILEVDVRKFDDVIRTNATDVFPYPRS